MALALCALFDRQTDDRVRGLWARLEAEGIRTLETHTHGRHQPHLSYAVLLEWDLARVKAATRALPDRGAFELTVQGTLSFPRGRAALAVAVTPEVAQRQSVTVHVLGGTGAIVHRHYEPGRWVPHVSVATRAPGALLARVATAVADVLPLTLRVDHAALIDSTSGRSWPVGRIP